MTERPITEQDWREVPRSQMFHRVIAAVDCARLDEVAAYGEDAPWVRYAENQLFPFLEDMKAIAELHEMLQEGDE